VLLRIGAVTMLALSLAACGGTKKKAASPRSDNLPAGCTVSEVDGIVTAFLAHPQLAPPALFQVYATYESNGGKYVTHSRTSALAHLRAGRRPGRDCA
jgi:hypothetical protein